MKLKEAFLFWFAQSFVATDQWINAVITPLLGGGQAWADETLSARTYRCAKDGRFIAKLAQPLINLLFIWQSPDDEVNAAAGEVVKDHCRRAFWKEKLRRYSPPEER